MDRIILQSLVQGAALPPLNRWALFLDVDGTLLDIAPTPGGAIVPDSLRTILPQLTRKLDGALAIVSGRSIAGIDRLFDPLRLAAAGQHGAELRRHPENPTETLVDSAPAVAAADKLRPLADRFPGIIVEEKGVSVAVHFRGHPEAEDAATDAVNEVAATSDGKLEILRGKMVLDLRPHGLSKGSAIEMLLSAAPFAGRIPVVLGDDRTDEDGFIAATRLGGIGIHIGETVPTAAEFGLPDPASCRQWLAELLE